MEHDSKHNIEAPSCIFCKISGQIEPASIIYEDDLFIAFMDAYPITEGHCLVIPKKHVVRLESLNSKDRAKLFEIGHKIITAQKKAGFGVRGTNLLINDGKAANQTIPHLHLHLLPREKGDFLKSIPRLLLHITGIFGLKTDRKKLDTQAKLISSFL